MKKLYLALAAAPMPVGLVTHYMRPVNMAPRLVSEGKNLFTLCGDYRKLLVGLKLADL